MSDCPPHLTRDFIGYGPRPPNPHWPDGARIALNIVLNYEEGGEASIPDGDPVTETGLIDAGGGLTSRDLAAESMYEYGSRVGIWRLLRILKERSLTATVFGCAQALERNHHVVSAIKELGLDICCHGRRWIQHQHLTRDQERTEISEAVKVIARLTGNPPLGWYCRYGPSINTRQLIIEHGGFLYDSDAYNDELPYWTQVEGKPHLIIPYSLVNNDARFIRGVLATADDFFAYLRDTFDVLYREGATHPKMMSVGLHMRLMGHPGRARALEKFLDYVRIVSDVWICRRIDIAKHWRATHPLDMERD